jgi:hypothetical protein
LVLQLLHTGGSMLLNQLVRQAQHLAVGLARPLVVVLLLLAACFASALAALAVRRLLPLPLQIFIIFWGGQPLIPLSGLSVAFLVLSARASPQANIAQGILGVFHGASGPKKK